MTSEDDPSHDSGQPADPAVDAAATSGSGSRRSRGDEPDAPGAYKPVSEPLYPTPPGLGSADAGPPRGPARSHDDGGLYPTRPSRPAPQTTAPRRPKPSAPPPRVARPPQPRPPRRDTGAYYVGTDWLRVIVGTLASLIVLLAIAAAGYYLFDRIDSFEGDEPTSDDGSTGQVEVDVFRCAGEDPITTQLPPPASLVVGRNASGTWLAFENLQPPPRQLWVRADDMAGFNISTVGVVPCAESDLDFPTPFSGPPAAPTGTDEVESPTATPQTTKTPEPTEIPVATSTPEPTPTPPPPPPTEPAEPAEG